jgi:serine/threonine protein kinase
MSLHSRLDAKTDVWALGCTLFAMLFGESPFERASAQGSIDLAVQNGTYELPDRPLDDLPPELLRIMSKMLALDPKDRPALDAIIAELGELPSIAQAKVPLDPPAKHAESLKVVQDLIMPLLKPKPTAAARASNNAAARAALFGTDSGPPANTTTTTTTTTSSTNNNSYCNCCNSNRCFEADEADRSHSW